MPHITLYPALIRDALKSVRYPGEESDIVTSGMVEDNIRIEENKVSLSIRFKKRDLARARGGDHTPISRPHTHNR